MPVILDVPSSVPQGASPYAPVFAQMAMPAIAPPVPEPQVSKAFAPKGASASNDNPSNAPLFKQLVDSYRSQGWSSTQAVNIASVQIRGEGAGLGSGGMDAASGGSNGISQWDRNRWKNLLNWTAANNLDPRSVAGQTGFTTHELRGAYSGVNPNSVASIVHGYESPRSDLEPGEISRSQKFAIANMANPSVAMSLPVAAQPPATPVGQPGSPMAFANPGAPMVMPGTAPPSAGLPQPFAASPPAAPAPAAPQPDPWGSILAGIAQNLTRPPPGAAPQVNPNMMQPPPSISSLLAGTHPNQVLT